MFCFSYIEVVLEATGDAVSLLGLLRLEVTNVVEVSLAWLTRRSCHEIPATKNGLNKFHIIPAFIPYTSHKNSIKGNLKATYEVLLMITTPQVQ